MEESDLAKLINDLNFNEIIKRETRTILEWVENKVTYDYKDYRRTFLEAQKRFTNKGDKILFLIESLNYFNEKIIELTSTLQINGTDGLDETIAYERILRRDRLQEIDKCKKQKEIYESQIFYTVRDLEKLGIQGLEENAFSVDQVSRLTQQINGIIAKIDKLVLGQEIIYDFIDELKNDFNEMKDDFPLGKKRWYQRFSGVVASYFGNKGADILYDYLKSDLLKIIKSSGIEKLLG